MSVPQPILLTAPRDKQSTSHLLLVESHVLPEQVIQESPAIGQSPDADVEWTRLVVQYCPTVDSHNNGVGLGGYNMLRLSIDYIAIFFEIISRGCFMAFSNVSKKSYFSA